MTRGRAAVAAVVVAATLAGSTPAHSADLPDPPVAADGWTRLGPFQIRPTAVLRDVGWDTNVFLNRDNRVRDFTATLSPALEAVTLFGHRGRLDLTQGLDAVGFWDTSSQNHLNSRSTARGRYLVGDLLLSGTAGYRTEKLRPSEEISKRVRRRTAGLQTAVTWSRSERASLTLAAARDRYTYSGDPALFGSSLSSLDRDETDLSLRGHVRVLPKTDATLEVIRTQVDHTNPGLGRDAVMERVLPGLRFLPSALLRGQLALGAMRFEPDAPGQARYSGLVGAAELRAGLGRRLGVTAGWDRDLAFSIFGDNLFYVRDGVRLELATPVSRRMRLLTGGERSRLRYPEAVDIAGFTGLREDRIQRLWTGWAWAPEGEAGFGFRLEWQRRNSNFDLEEYSQVRIIGEATYAF